MTADRPVLAIRNPGTVRRRASFRGSFADAAQSPTQSPVPTIPAGSFAGGETGAAWKKTLRANMGTLKLSDLDPAR